MSWTLLAASFLAVPFSGGSRIDDCAAARKLIRESQGSDPSAAVEALRHAVQLCDEWQPHYYLACALEDSGRLVEALEHYRAGLALEESVLPARFQLAALYDRVSDVEAAQQHYEIFVASAAKHDEFEVWVDHANSRIEALREPARRPLDVDAAAVHDVLTDMAPAVAALENGDATREHRRLLYASETLRSEARKPGPDDVLLLLALVHAARELGEEYGLLPLVASLPDWAPEALVTSFLLAGHSGPSLERPPFVRDPLPPALPETTAPGVRVVRSGTEFVIGKGGRGPTVSVNSSESSSAFELDGNYRTVSVRAGNNAVSYRDANPLEVALHMNQTRDYFWLDRAAARALAVRATHSDSESFQGTVKYGQTRLTGSAQTSFRYTKLGEETLEVISQGAVSAWPTWKISFQCSHQREGIQTAPEIRIGSVRRKSPMTGAVHNEQVRSGTMWVVDDPEAPLILKMDATQSMTVKLPSMDAATRTLPIQWAVTEIRG